MNSHIFLKQYGERRTGTNFLSSLISANFENATVLMHVLGDKHSPPVDLQIGADDDALQWVHDRTWAAPAESTNLRDQGQLEYLQKIAGPLLEAMRCGRLGFLLSVKDPYAWIGSLYRFAGVGSHHRNDQELRNWMAPLCRRFNDSHRAWLRLAEENPQNAKIIRYEDLLSDAETILAELATTFQLVRRGVVVTSIAGTISPLHWDQHQRQASRWEFAPGYYLNRDYLKYLPPVMRDGITDLVDWELMERFGYRFIEKI